MYMERIGSADFVYPFTGGMDVDVWETADGRHFCTSEWNGETWLKCWEVFSDMSTGQSFTAQPLYRYEVEGIDIDSLEENSPEWDHALEIIGLDF